MARKFLNFRLDTVQKMPENELTSFNDSPYLRYMAELASLVIVRILAAADGAEPILPSVTQISLASDIERVIYE